MIDVATAVKRDLGNALLHGALPDQVTDQLSSLSVGADLAGLFELRVKG